MVTKMKHLGVAMLTLAALACAGAGAASAKVIHDFESSTKGPVIITGEGLPGTSFQFEFGEGWTLTCLTNNANGTIASLPTSKLTVEFTHSSCLFNEATASLESKGCRYVFSGETNETQHGEAELECEPGAKLLATTEGCTFEVGPQVLGPTVTYKKTDLITPKDMDLSLTGKGIKYTKEGAFCAFVGGNGKDLTINGVYTMKAYEDKEGKEGKQLDFTYSETVV